MWRTKTLSPVCLFSLLVFLPFPLVKKCDIFSHLFFRAYLRCWLPSRPSRPRPRLHPRRSLWVFTSHVGQMVTWLLGCNGARAPTPTPSPPLASPGRYPLPCPIPLSASNPSFSIFGRLAVDYLLTENNRSKSVLYKLSVKRSVNE